MRSGPWFTFFCLISFCNPAAGQSGDFSPDKFYYYAAGTVHVPHLRKKKDGDIGIGYNWGSKNTAFEARAVYSPVRYGAVMASYYLSGSKAVRNNEQTGTNYHFADISVGAYQEKDRASGSIFAGVSQGRLYNNYGADKFSRFTIRRWFLQPSIAYLGENYRLGLSLRLSRLYYPKGEASFDINGRDLVAIQKIEKDAPFFLPELGIFSSVQLRPVYISINITSIFPDADNLKFSRFSVSLMLHYDLGTLAGKKKEE